MSNGFQALMAITDTRAIWCSAAWQQMRALVSDMSLHNPMTSCFKKETVQSVHPRAPGGGGIASSSSIAWLVCVLVWVTGGLE